MKKTAVVLCLLLVVSCINIVYAVEEGDTITVENLFTTLLGNVWFWATTGLVVVLLYNSKRAWDLQAMKESRKSILGKK